MKWMITDLQTKEMSICGEMDIINWANDIFWDDETIDFSLLPVEKAIECLEISQYQVDLIR